MENDNKIRPITISYDYTTEACKPLSRYLDLLVAVNKAANGSYVNHYLNETYDNLPVIDNELMAKWFHNNSTFALEPIVSLMGEAEINDDHDDLGVVDLLSSVKSLLSDLHYSTEEESLSDIFDQISEDCAFTLTILNGWIVFTTDNFHVEIKTEGSYENFNIITTLHNVTNYWTGILWDADNILRPHSVYEKLPSVYFSYEPTVGTGNPTLGVFKVLNTIRVTAADYNGETFDGRPLEPLDNWDVEGYGLVLGELLTSDMVSMSKRSVRESDYAMWNCKDLNENVFELEPGDMFHVIKVDGNYRPIPFKLGVHVTAGVFK